MRVGLVFLAGLLVGGLAVAWLVAEVPRETTAGAVPAQAPAEPMTPPATTPVLADLPAPRSQPERAPTATEEQSSGDSGNDPVGGVSEEPAANSDSAAPVELAPAAPDEPVRDTPLLPALKIPVQGIKASDLTDSFTDARGQDRVHDAIDIMAPEGTPVLAAADGPVVKLFDSVPGGLTLYQFDEAGNVAFYYAHMQRYAEGVEEGMQLRQGDLVGYVGHTGNADPAAPHLHFAIFVLGPEKRWWEGEAINPYPLFVGP